MKRFRRRIFLFAILAVMVGCGVLTACGTTFGPWIVIKSPTCEEEGEQIRYAKKNESVFEKTFIPALGHDWGDEDGDGWIVRIEPTYETEGLAERICTRCGHSETKTLDMIDEPIHLKIMDGSTLLKKVYAGEDGSYTLTPETMHKVGYTFLKFVDPYGNDYPLSGSITEAAIVYTVWEIIPTATFAQLSEYAAAGAEKIYLVSDIEITESIYVVGQTEIYVTEDHTLTRAANFGGDMWIVGETEEGENTQIVYGWQAALSLTSKGDATLTIDGNKDNMEVDVSGSAILQLHSSVVNVREGVVIQNCKKVSNQKVLDDRYALSYPERIGGAAVTVASGTFNMYGGAILHNEVNLDEGDGAEADGEENVSSCGGAIYSNANVNIYGGVLVGNKAARGGAIYNYRTARIEGGTFEANEAAFYAGAVYLSGSQYAQLFIGVEGAETNLVTMHANTAGKSGGAIFGQTKNSITVYGGATFSENVAASNGGAINTSGALTILDATFCGNRAASKGGAIYVYYSDSALTTRQVLLKSGLFTANEASKGGAVAFSASDASFAKGTIGTVEAVTFRGNQAFATATEDPDLSDSEDDETGGAYNGNGGAIYVARNSDVTISGATFDANSSDIKGGAIYITGNSTVAIAGATFTANASKQKAGAVYITGAATVAVSGRSSFTSNTAEGSGGAILCYTDAVLTVDDATFEGNTSADGSYGGGALYFAAGAEGILEYATFTGNEATAYNGGAIGVYGKSHVVIRKTSRFQENSAARYGGAIYAATADSCVEAYSVVFIGNTAGGNGGAVYGYTDTVFTFRTCLFYRNEAGGNGGALYFSGADVTIAGNMFDGNTSNGTGGAIGAYSSTVLSVRNTTFRNNEAATNGGALYFSGSGAAINDVKFTNNHALSNGGAIGVYSASTVVMGGVTTFTDNTAAANGGAVYVSNKGGVLKIKEVVATGNSAASGGFLYLTTGGTAVYLYGGTVKENTATSGDTFQGNATSAILHLKMSAIDTDYDPTAHDTATEKFGLDADFDEEWIDA